MTESKSRISNTVKIKIAAALVLLVLVGIVIWQNRQDVRTDVFWVSLTMPLALLLFLMLASGFVVGVVGSRLYRRR